MMSPRCVADAHTRIGPYINRTPLLESSLLNQWLGHRIVFKAECFQKVGAFKFRGAMNALLRMQEQSTLPSHVVTFSSGNHAQAVAHSAKLLGIKATIFLPEAATAIKKQATLHYGAEVVVTETRQEAEERAAAYVDQGSVFVHPYDNDDIIAGQGTACYEALRSGLKPDVIFATCGGGGWLSGTHLAAELLAPNTAVYGAEPLQANDAVRSLRQDTIFKFGQLPSTLADGARTLAVSERTFAYLKQLSGMVEVTEEAIVYWTQWLTHLLKTSVEPTSAVAMAGLAQWLDQQDSHKTALVMLSGGNVSAEAYQTVWRHDYLSEAPRPRRLLQQEDDQYVVESRR